MRQQRGYVFHKGKSWFVRYADFVRESDGSVKRKLICKKLDVEYGDEFRTRKSVAPFVADLLRPINLDLVDARSTMPIVAFVEEIYLPQYVEQQLRPSTYKQYEDIWKNHLKPRLGKLTLREFRTVHAQQLVTNVADQAKLGRSSLNHAKAFLSGVFNQCRRLGVLDAINPLQGVKIPRTDEPADTYAYNLQEVKSILSRIKEPARTVVLTAALSGLRKGEIRGLRWEDFDGKELRVARSVWNSEITLPKTKRSRASIPVVKMLADALDVHRERAGKLTQPNLPIFQGGTGAPLNLDNLAKRGVIPALEVCVNCRRRKSEHIKTETHLFSLDNSVPQWHGWHSFRRGLATNLHQLGVDDKTIQAIMRHSNVGITMNVYVKSTSESQINALGVLEGELGKQTCNDLATLEKGPVN